MLNELKFSIIIPAFNAEKTIRKSIESIQEQTYQNFEVIVIDDGSIDDTKYILDELVTEYSNITIKTINNSGPGEARNRGIELAQGEYLLFIDVDDYIKFDFLELYNKLLLQKEYDLIVTGYRTKIYDDNELISEQITSYSTTKFSSHAHFMEELYPLTNNQMMYVVWNKVYKKEIVQQNNIKFPSYRSCEDRIFNLRYFKYVDNALITDIINFEYSFDGKNSLTNRFFENKYQTFDHWYKILLESIKQDYDGYASLYLKGVMSTFVSLHSDTCTYSYNKKRDYIKEILIQDDVKEAGKISSTETLMKSVIALVIRTNNITVNYIVSKAIHFVSQHSPRLIEVFKSKH